MGESVGRVITGCPGCRDDFCSISVSITPRTGTDLHYTKTSCYNFSSLKWNLSLQYMHLSFVNLKPIHWLK